MSKYRVVIAVEAYEDDPDDFEALDLPYKVLETTDQKKAVDALYSVIAEYRGTFERIA